MSAVIDVFVDGGSRGNPGQAAIGGQFLIAADVIHEFSQYLGVATNNEAEYQGLLTVARLLPEVLQNNPDAGKVVIHMDSKLVVEQVSGRWKIKEDRLRQLAQQVSVALSAVKIPVQLVHVPRAQNAAADRLVNMCLDDYARQN